MPAMDPKDVVKLTALMQLTSGRPEIAIGLIDGPVAMGHPELEGQNLREIPGTIAGTCAHADSVACMHGTFVAGMLSAKRGSSAPAICPGCTLIVRPIFAEGPKRNGKVPSATPEELATAIIDSVDAGARLINLSAALAAPSSRGEHKLEQALSHAARSGVITVAAAGNQAMVGSSVITRHPWVIAVASCDLQGRPTEESNLGGSIGRRGLSAPGENISSLGTEGKPLAFGGTSAAAPFVTGAIALLWSAFPAANSTQVRLAVTQYGRHSRNRVVPPLLDAWAAYERMLASM
jgi:subtilisin family serine protease